MNIGIVIPCFEQEQYLERCLASVLWQLQSGDQVIVVGEHNHVIDQKRLFEMRPHPYAGEHPPLTVLTNLTPRRGISGSRNHGVSLLGSQIDWIKFLDADDVLAPFALDSFRKIRVPEEVAAVSGGMFQVVNGKTIPTLLHTNWPSIGQMNPSLVSANFIRRSAFMAVGGFDEGIGFEEDWDLWLKLKKAGNKFGRVEFPVCFYWIFAAERAAKERDHSVAYQGERIDVREYFRRHYGINPL